MPSVFQQQLQISWHATACVLKLISVKELTFRGCVKSGSLRTFGRLKADWQQVVAWNDAIGLSFCLQNEPSEGWVGLLTQALRLFQAFEWTNQYYKRCLQKRQLPILLFVRNLQSEGWRRWFHLNTFHREAMEEIRTPWKPLIRPFAALPIGSYANFYLLLGW